MPAHASAQARRVAQLRATPRLSAQDPVARALPRLAPNCTGQRVQLTSYAAVMAVGYKSLPANLSASLAQATETTLPPSVGAWAAARTRPRARRRPRLLGRAGGAGAAG
jgi:hypothetical protein